MEVIFANMDLVCVPFLRGNKGKPYYFNLMETRKSHFGSQKSAVPSDAIMVKQNDSVDAL